MIIIIISYYQLLNDIFRDFVVVVVFLRQLYIFITLEIYLGGVSNEQNFFFLI